MHSQVPSIVRIVHLALPQRLSRSLPQAPPTKCHLSLTTLAPDEFLHDDGMIPSFLLEMISKAFHLESDLLHDIHGKN